MAIRYSIDTHNVAFPSKVRSGMCGHTLNCYITEDTDNGELVGVTNWHGYDEYNVTTAPSDFAGVIRGSTLEFLSCRKRNGDIPGPWRYKDIVLKSQADNIDKWWRLGGVGLNSLWSVFAPLETKAFRNLKNAWSATAECEISCAII